MNRSTFAQVFAAVHRLWTQNGVTDPQGTIDNINQLLFACGWTPHQYQQRIAEAMRNDEQITVPWELN